MNDITDIKLLLLSSSVMKFSVGMFYGSSLEVVWIFITSLYILELTCLLLSIPKTPV